MITNDALARIALSAATFHNELRVAEIALADACTAPMLAVIDREHWHWFYLLMWAKHRYAAWECEQHMRREYAAELPIVEALLERSSPWSEANSSR